MSNFLHSKFSKMRWIWGMSRAVKVIISKDSDFILNWPYILSDRKNSSQSIQARWALTDLVTTTLQTCRGSTKLRPDPARPDDPTFWPDPTCNFSLLRNRPDSEIATRPDPTDPTFWPDPSAPLLSCPYNIYKKKLTSAATPGLRQRRTQKRYIWICISFNATGLPP